jgi:hypothetical protein
VLEAIMQVVHDAGYDIHEVFIRQDEVIEDIVSQETMDGIFAAKIDDATRRELLELVSYPVIVPTFDGTLAEAWELVRQELLPTEAEKKAKIEAAKKAAKRKPAPTPEPAVTATPKPPPPLKKKIGGTTATVDLAAALRTSLAMENVKAAGEIKGVRGAGAIVLPAAGAKPRRGSRPRA